MPDNEKEIVKDLCTALGIGSPLASLLVKRGIRTVSDAKAFLYPSVEDAEDPFLLSGMHEAVDRIRGAIEQGEKIVVYGDYDCDGITATSILYGYLRSLGADVSYFIPNRFDTGYGLSVEALEEIAETEFPDLLITVDCGISSSEEAEYLADVLAIDLIVTDHHELPSTLPNCIVVNPKLDPESKSVDLCGAGVAFKLVQALGGSTEAWKYIELAAIGTIADIVPLTKENRLIAYLGLKKINSRESINKGLRLLIRSIGLEKVDSSDVGYRIAPRINALGRLDDCTEVVTLFTEQEFVVLQGLIEKLTRVNELRKSLVEQVHREALELLKDYDLATHRIIFLYKKDWNHGVLGLVAGKLKGEFSRPVILVSGEESLRGSARSVEGVDIHATIKSAEQFLVKFGGHKGAAGLTVLPENLIAARNRMDEYLEEHYPPEAFVRDDTYDLSLPDEEITVRLADEMAYLEPTGESNRKPVFKFSSEGRTFMPFSNGQHVKSRINSTAELVAFGQANMAEGVQSGIRFDLLCECSKDVYKNRERVEMKVDAVYARDFAPQGDGDLLLFNRFLRSNLYKEEACDLTLVEESELSDLLYDDHFCTLYISYSPESASRFPIGGKVPYVEYGSPLNAPWNEVLIAPEKVPFGYRRIVLLDTPLTKGFAARLVKSSGAEVYVVKDRYPYREVFRSVDLSPEALRKSYLAIRSYLYSGGGASSPIDLMTKVAPSDAHAFLIHFYCLFESGSLSIGQGFALSLRNFVDPQESLLYRRISALKKRL